jgi:hypothetical protein
MIVYFIGGNVTKDMKRNRQFYVTCTGGSFSIANRRFSGCAVLLSYTLLPPPPPPSSMKECSPYFKYNKLKVSIIKATSTTFLEAVASIATSQ